MSNLLQHGDGKNPNKKVDIKVKEISRTEAGFVDIPESIIPTFDVNMRVDNHTRNAILALSRATADKRTASEMASILIESYLEKLNPQTLEVYQDFLGMLEDKDKMEYKLKNR